MGGKSSTTKEKNIKNIIDENDDSDPYFKINNNRKINGLLTSDFSKLENFKLYTISEDIYQEVEEQIIKMTGFKPYGPMKIKLNEKQKPIDGTYYQFNKGCICYSLINNGWIDEEFIPDSMKYYKNHNYKEDKRNDQDFLRRIMSIIDLSQLWVNIGGKCPFVEIDLEEVRKRCYLVLKDYFDKPTTGIMQSVGAMTRQNKDYVDLIGDINVKFFSLREKLNNNPCIKNAIDSGIIKKRDIIKCGRHCFIFDEVFEEDSKKKYSFHDSLSYFFPAKNDKYNNCECNKKKGFIFASEDTKLINTIDNDEMIIGVFTVVN